MDFWGVKVKPSKSLLCPVEDSSYLHISNAAVGEVKGALGSERIVLRVKVQDSNDEIVLGTLVPGNRDNVVLDLIMGKPFTLLHSSKTHSVYFSGYRTEGGDELPIREAAELPARKENGLAIVKSQAASSDSDDDDGDEDDDEDDDDSDDDDEDDDEDLDIHKISMRNAMMDSDDDDGDEEDEDDDESDDGDEDDDESDDAEDEEEVPQPKGKKRPLEAVTPPAEKKIKTPSGKTPVVHKTDEKTTPAAAKKSSAKKDKDKKKDKATPTPNSDSKAKVAASYRCDICSRGFTTESALTQHNTAKHK